MRSTLVLHRAPDTRDFVRSWFSRTFHHRANSERPPFFAGVVVMFDGTPTLGFPEPCFFGFVRRSDASYEACVVFGHSVSQHSVTQHSLTPGLLFFPAI